MTVRFFEVILIVCLEIAATAYASLLLFDQPAVFYGNATGAATVGLMIWWYYR